MTLVPAVCSPRGPSTAWAAEAKPATAAAAPLVSPLDREIEARQKRFSTAGGGAEAVTPLLGVVELWPLLDGAGRRALTSFVEQAAASTSARPTVRARARFTHALLLDRLGRAADAAAARAALGLVTTPFVVGPFDNEGRAGHAAVYGPEKELAGALALDGSHSYEGKERPVAWRQLPPLSVGGMLPLDAVLRPDANATAYVAFAVRSEVAQPVALRLGSAGAVKAWVNGRPVHSHDVERPARFDQDAAPAWLEAGLNRVVIKVSGGETGGLGLYVRLTRPDGAPLTRATVSTAKADVAAAPPARSTAPARLPAVDELGRALAAAAQAKGASAAALTAAGLYEFHVAPEDPERHRAAEWLRQAAAKQPSPEAWARVAAAEADANDQRHALETGLRLAAGAAADWRTAVAGKPAAAPLLTTLGALDEKARRERRAEETWRLALKADPRWFPAALELAELEGERGLPALGWHRLEGLAQGFAAGPDGEAGVPLKLLRTMATLAERRGMRAASDALWARLTAADAADADAWQERFTSARARGALPDALAALDGLLAARPDMVALAIDRAEVLEGAGKAPEAHKALAAALELCPEEARILEKDGRLLHRLGRGAEALPLLRKALQLRPQNPELRAYLAELEERGGGGDAVRRADLARAYTEDVPAILKRSPARDAAGAPAEVLYDGTAVRVHKNGLSEIFQQRVVRVLDEKGARDEGDFAIRYTPETQSVEVRAARVHRANGEVVEAISTDESDLSEPWYGLYYDVRGLTIHFAQLEPGDVVDVEYVVSDVGRRNLFADYFGDLHFLQEDVPRRETRYVLIAPKGKKLYLNQPKLPAGATLEKSDETVGDERVLSFRAKNVPKVDVEPLMPGFSEVAAYLHVSTYKTWDEVTRWYEGLVRGQLEANAAIQSAVRQAVAKIPPRDERARIRALYELVVKRTRYVGLEFGIHGYKPYRPSQVFARKFGDCKDKASLLVVMLREAGIDASLVLARTRRNGDLADEPASLAPFDHAIVWVPKYDLYLDGTAEFSGADELPAQDQAIQVLVVQKGQLGRTPVLPAARNRVRTLWQVALDAKGAATIGEQMTVAGEAAHDWRNYYQAAGEQRDKYDAQWNRKQPGARVEEVEMQLAELGKPVEVRARVTAPHYAHPEGADALAVPVLGREPDLLRSYATLSSRKYDLVLGYPWRQEERVLLKAPAGWAARRLPEAKSIKSPFGSFELKAEEKGGAITVTATLEVTSQRVKQADYAKFRGFLADVDAAVGQEIVLGQRRTARAATATPAPTGAEVRR